jgi:hypothetical protein
MMSSKYFANTITVRGFLDSSPSKTPLWGANKAYLGYCSSDGYMGDTAASNDTWGYHFRGQSLVRAMITALINDHSMNSATTIVFAGSSAGARGVMTHLNSITQQMFPPYALLVALLDSPYYLDIEPYSTSFQGFDYQEKQKYLYYNTTGIISKECGETYSLEGDRWKCQFGQYRMPFVTAPYFLIASQYDSYQLSNNIQDEPAGYDSMETSYATDFANSTRGSLDSLADSLRVIKGKGNGENNVGFGLYSWACYNHAVGTTDAFYTLATSTGVTQKTAFEGFLSGGAEPPVDVWMDECTEFACGTNCERM